MPGDSGTILFCSALCSVVVESTPLLLRPCGQNLNGTGWDNNRQDVFNNMDASDM